MSTIHISVNGIIDRHVSYAMINGIYIFLIKYYKMINENFCEIKKKRVSLNFFLSKCRIYNIPAVAYLGGWGAASSKVK